MKGNIIEFGEFFHKNKFIPLILHWFKKNQRNLYWRKNRSLYLTYLSEIMLQQTTVKTVENKISEIINIFPSFNSFKTKKLEHLLKVWSGLGYYNRAENLFKAVTIINNIYHGELPDNRDSLISLPGVGKYTSSAILAIGHNKKSFPVDVNVKRLIQRLSGLKLKDDEVENILNSACKKKISYRSLAESMMDFSSIICKKNNPNCSKCIFSSFCKSAFKLRGKETVFSKKIIDGRKVKKGKVVATIAAKIKTILTAERTALNFLGHASGVATLTNKFVKKSNKKTKICCTRKTTPNLRLLDKYAVKIGGGFNHRLNLSDEIMIKDNHVVIVKNLRKLIEKAIRTKKVVTVEIDSFNQLKTIFGLKFKRILFDNMSIKNLKLGVKLAKKYYQTEASGNINLKKVKSIAKTGVDRISVGGITHSAPAIDFKLEI